MSDEAAIIGPSATSMSQAKTGGLSAQPSARRPCGRLVQAVRVFVPVPTLPDWLEPIAKASAVTLTADAARTFALTGGTPDSLAGSLTRSRARSPGSSGSSSSSSRSRSGATGG